MRIMILVEIGLTIGVDQEENLVNHGHKQDGWADVVEFCWNKWMGWSESWLL